MHTGICVLCVENVNFRGHSMETEMKETYTYARDGFKINLIFLSSDKITKYTIIILKKKHTYVLL